MFVYCGRDIVFTLAWLTLSTKGRNYAPLVSVAQEREKATRGSFFDLYIYLYIYIQDVCYIEFIQHFFLLPYVYSIRWCARAIIYITFNKCGKFCIEIKMRVCVMTLLSERDSIGIVGCFVYNNAIICQLYITYVMTFFSFV